MKESARNPTTNAPNEHQKEYPERYYLPEQKEQCPYGNCIMPDIMKQVIIYLLITGCFVQATASNPVNVRQVTTRHKHHPLRQAGDPSLKKGGEILLWTGKAHEQKSFRSPHLVGVGARQQVLAKDYNYAPSELLEGTVPVSAGCTRC